MGGECGHRRRKIYGPHFEEFARQWCFEHAAPESLGGRVSWVRPTEIACQEHRHGRELDLVVQPTAFGAERISAIGEATGTLTPVGLPQLVRLEHLRGLLPSARVGALPKLLLFARPGFTGDLRREAGRRSDLELVDLHRMYHGE